MIDIEKFLFLYQEQEFKPLNDAPKKALTDLLCFINNDPDMVDFRWISYCLATVCHECADTYEPIAEYGRGKGRAYGKPAGPYNQIYYGRGFVQLTWLDNYATMSKVCGVDLVKEPDLAMQPDIAYKIMSHGMRHGSFTGVGLSKYINADKCDYLNARRIINGLDAAGRIAGHAAKFEAILKECTNG